MEQGEMPEQYKETWLINSISAEKSMLFIICILVRIVP